MESLRIGEANLKDQLANMPHDTEYLSIKNNTPSDDDWALISKHFTNVKDLEMSSGWSETLNDSIPLHWPLERLALIDPCGELVRTPWILEGRVKHLVLAFTAGLRFDGPTNKELVQMHRAEINSGEKKEEKAKGIKVIFIPKLAFDWLYEKTC